MTRQFDFSFAKNYHIKKQGDFNTVFRYGREIKLSLYKCRFVRNKLPYNRLGIIIRKKVTRNAVSRNYEKRIIRECYRTLVPEYLDKTFYDLVIIQMKKYGTFEDKKKEIKKILKIINKYNEKK